MTSVAVIGDVRLYREGIARALADEPAFDVAATLDPGTADLRRLAALAPDVVLLNSGGDDPITLLHGVAAIAPGAKVVVVGIHERPEQVVALAEAGAAGYVPREASLDELFAAVTRAARGELVCSPHIVSTLFGHLHAMADRRGPGTTIESQGPAPEAPDDLTARENDVLALVGRGLSNKQIALELCIALPTVKNHVHNILRKLKVDRRGQAAAQARRGPQAAALLVQRD